jgi:hypothetical protein
VSRWLFTPAGTRCLGYILGIAGALHLAAGQEGRAVVDVVLALLNLGSARLQEWADERLRRE